MEQNNIIYITIGWLLGVLSQIIVSVNAKYRKRQDVKTLLFSELRDIAFRLSAGCYTIQAHFGIENKETLTWLKSKHIKYGDESSRKTIEAIERMLKYTDEQIQKGAILLKANEGIGLSLKKFAFSSADSIIESLSLFNSEFQRDIIEIKFQINALNQEIENAEYYHRLTFVPSNMETNAEAIKGNIKAIYMRVVDMSKQIVMKIEEVLEK